MRGLTGDKRVNRKTIEGMADEQSWLQANNGKIDKRWRWKQYGVRSFELSVRILGAGNGSESRKRDNEIVHGNYSCVECPNLQSEIFESLICSSTSGHTTAWHSLYASMLSGFR